MTVALQANSPAINAANDATCPPTDQRTVDRPQGGHCDIGAYEALTISGNAGVGGAVLSYDGGSVTADAAGNYVIVVPFWWHKTVTPSKPGYVFSPPSRSYTNVDSSYYNQDYTASLATYIPIVQR